MALLIRCPTEDAILLAGFTDAIGVMRYATQSNEMPGLHLKPTSGLPLHDQLAARFKEYLQAKCINRDANLKLTLNHHFEETLEVPGGNPVTLYLGQVSWDLDPPNNWPTMADLLRGMPKNRHRLAYMRALQLLSNGLKDDLQAVETDKLPF